MIDSNPVSVCGGFPGFFGIACEKVKGETGEGLFY